MKPHAFYIRTLSLKEDELRECGITNEVLRTFSIKGVIMPFKYWVLDSDHFNELNNEFELEQVTFEHYQMLKLTGVVK